MAKTQPHVRKGICQNIFNNYSGKGQYTLSGGKKWKHCKIGRMKGKEKGFRVYQMQIDGGSGE